MAGAGGTESAGGAAGDSHSHFRHSHAGEVAGFCEGGCGLTGSQQHRIPFFANPQHGRFAVVSQPNAAGAAAEV